MGKNRMSELGTVNPVGVEPKQPLAGANGVNGNGEGSHSTAGGGVEGAAGVPPGAVDSPRSGSSLIESLRAKDAKRRCLPPPDDETEAKAPFLWELLTSDLYADGSTRLLTEIVIRRSSGVYDITLRDHASRQSKRGACLNLGALVEALEGILCDPTRPWTVYDSYLNPEVDAKGQPIKKKLDR